VQDGWDESAAIAAARAGDRESFCAIVESHQEAAFRTAFLIVRDAGEAEDVAQEAFVRAYRGLRGFREGEAFRPWLLRIVTNLALNSVRARGRRTGLLHRFGGGADERPADAGVVAGEERDLLLRAINELPEGDRVILYLRYYMELSERELATAIGRPPGTVKSRLNRATRRLRDVIEERYPSLKPVSARAGAGDA
jgi:RNA polymerase sigma-70 factor (ECF subfamily)